MANNTEIAVWAARRAAEETNKNNPKSSCNETTILFREAGQALARYIQEHEKPPVDPDLQLAREIFASKYAEPCKSEALKGQYDGYSEIGHYLYAIEYFREKGLPEL